MANNRRPLTGAQNMPAQPAPVFFEVEAAYNRDGLPLPDGKYGSRVLSIDTLVQHPYYWEWVNDNETEEILMDLYVARTRHMQ